MKYILFALLLMGCSRNSPPVDLTRTEIAMLDSLQFDKSIVADVKTITKKTFKILPISNISGKEIPAHMAPKMIFFKVDKSFDVTLLDDTREKSRHSGYNIYDINKQEDEYITIIISKVN